MAPIIGNGGVSGSDPLSPLPLQVALVASHDVASSAPADVPFVAIPLAHSAPLPLAAFASPEWPRASAAHPPARVGVPLDIGIRAQPLVAMARLSDELQRAEHPFPAEVAWPVRIRGDIEAHYPAGARDAGREGTVLLWVVVDETAKIEEIKVVEGDDEFAQAAISAVNAAQFAPASEDGDALIRYPIALEFEFVLPPAKAAVASAPQ